MNKNRLLKSIMGVCAVIIAAVLLLCVRNAAVFAGYSFTDAENYTPGNAEITEPVKNLEIDWTGGKISFAYHSGETVMISETSKKEIGPDLKMRWRLDGDTLYIRYAKPGFIDFDTAEKELTVALPEKTVLGNVEISAASAALSLPDLQADSLTADVTSGDIIVSGNVGKVSADSTAGYTELKLCGDTEEISAVSTGGRIVIEAENADRVTADTTSGPITVSIKNAEEFTADSTSGKIQAELGTVKKAVFECTSGDIRLKIDQFETLSVDSTSGDVIAQLPEKPGFTAYIDTNSGRITSMLPLAEQEEDSYVCGDGSGKVGIETTTGNISLYPVED